MPDQLPYRYTYEPAWYSTAKKNDETTMAKRQHRNALIKIILIYGTLAVLLTLLFMGYL